MKRAGSVSLALLLGSSVGCSGAASSAPDGGRLSVQEAGVDAIASRVAGNDLLLSEPCPGVDVTPPTLECTGLYTDVATKRVAAAARPFTPAHILWSDGAEKSRWIYLPPGTKIDTSSPSDWMFPVGTRLWKEFRVGGVRIETRLYRKVSPTFWVKATYAWNADESATTASKGGDVPLAGGGTWHIPTSSECEKCHSGRREHVLGFEQALLGLPDAKGLTLADLAAEGRLSPTPANVHLQIGDDGTGLAGPALGWIHTNCGVTCHNTNQTSFAFGADMNLRLDPTLLDGRSSVSFAPLTTTIGLSAQTPAFSGSTRVVPGDAANSLLVQLISQRGPGMQMPPIATSIVDDIDVANVFAWVDGMPHLSRRPLEAGVDADASASDAPDETVAPIPDAAVLDQTTEASVSVVDASPPPDATLIDADAGLDVAVNDAAPPAVDSSIDDGGVGAATDALGDGGTPDGGADDAATAIDADASDSDLSIDSGFADAIE